MPAALGDFAARGSELNALTDLTAQAQAGTLGGIPVIGIVGTAGVGKTTLVNHLSHLVCDRFPDGQLYADMRGFGETGQAMNPDEALRRFLDAFGTPPSAQSSPGEQAGLFRSLLAGKRVLIVLDNVRDAAQVRPLLPGSQGSLVLVTSRSQLTGLAADGAHFLQLKPFTDDEAREMLAHRLGPDKIAREPQAVGELIRLCAGLPLALSVAIAQAAVHPDFPLTVLADEFRDRKLDRLDTGDPGTTARTVFSWSYQHLSQQAASTFRLLSAHPGPELNVAAAASLTAVPAGRARSALDELARASLLEERRPGRFTCHDLLRAYAAEQAHAIHTEDDMSAASHRMLDHYGQTAAAAARRMYPAWHNFAFPAPLTGVTVTDFREYEQAAAWFEAEQAVLLAAATHAADSRMDAYCCQISRALGPYLNRKGRWLERLAMCRTALSAGQRLGDPAALGLTTCDFATACAQLGDFAEATARIGEALELFARLDDQDNEAFARRTQARILYMQGRHEDSLTAANDALRLYESCGNHAGAGYAENAVGWSYMLLGRYAEALPHCRRAVELQRESGSLSGTADSLDTLAHTYLGLGEIAESRNCWRQALGIYNKIGDANARIAALTGLGDAHLAAADTQAARRCWQEALATIQDLPNADPQPLMDRLSEINMSPS